jgi:hypothetical protein
MQVSFFKETFYKTLGLLNLIIRTRETKERKLKHDIQRSVLHIFVVTF